jgi:hypothetical protein
MRRALPSLALMAFLSCLPICASPQSKGIKPVASGSISGQVMLEGRPVPGVVVTLMPRNSGPQSQPLAKVTTDGEGRFRLMNVAAGAFVIRAVALSFVSSEAQNFEQGKSIIVDEGEVIDGMNISLTRGAVISGRVTDANHQPLVETNIELKKVDEQGRNQPFTAFNFANPYAYRTDDRGEYRIYGLPAGRYKVSVGRAPNDGSLSGGQGGVYYLKTYHPDVTDEGRAEIVEVKEGEEATNIDITLAPTLKTYNATGRIVDAATGQPLANIYYGIGTIIESYGSSNGKTLGGRRFMGSRTTTRGEFRLNDLLPGRYAAIMGTDETTEGFAEPVPFEIKDEDVSGLEIRVRRGASVSGFATVEGTNDPKILALLQSVILNIQTTPAGLESLRINQPRIAADGSFRINGLRAGRVQIRAFNNSPNERLFLSRIEYNGKSQKELDLQDGEELAGVHLVFSFGSSVIRGQVNFENGASPEGAQYYISAVSREKDRQQSMSAVVDARGKFVIEGLVAGDYEVRLMPVGIPQRKAMPFIKKNITLQNGAEIQVTFNLDSNGNDKDEREKR